MQDMQRQKVLTITLVSQCDGTERLEKDSAGNRERENSGLEQISEEKNSQGRNRVLVEPLEKWGAVVSLLASSAF